MKYISYVRYALITISVVIIAMSTMSGNSNDVGLMIDWMLLILGLTFLSVIVLTAYSTTKDPKGAKGSLIASLLLLALLGVSYALADESPIQLGLKIFDNPTELLIADTGLFATYIVSVLTIASIALTELYNVFKK